MTRANVEQSLDAVERALSHFAASLDRAGFVAGEPAYRQMAEVVVGQWLWAEETGMRDLEPGFWRVAELAESVSGRLRPYVEVMEGIAALRGLVEDRWGVEPGTDGARVAEVLLVAEGAMTAAEVAEAAGLSAAASRRELRALVERGVVDKVRGRPLRYRPSGARLPARAGGDR